MAYEERIRTVLAEAATLVNEARALQEHEGDDRELPAEVRQQIEEILNHAETLRAEAQRLESDGALQRRSAALMEYLSGSAGMLPGLGGPALAAREAQERRGREAGGSGPAMTRFGVPTDLHQRAFANFLRSGVGALGPTELRALSTGVDAAGGYLVPDVFFNGLLEAIEDAFIMRRLARVLPRVPSGSSLHVPAADSEMTDAEWTPEVATVPVDTVNPFGGRMLTPHPLAKEVDVSNAMLRLPSFDLEGWVRRELAAKHGRAEEAGFMTGTGAQQAYGIFTSGARGTDVAAASATDIASDDLIQAEFTLKAQYRRGARWILHRTILKEIALLKDGNGQYIWRQGLAAGLPSMLLNYPVEESEFAPSSSATGLYVAALGNWKEAYWIVDALEMGVQRLTELLARSSQTGFIGRKETDGMIVNGNGVVRLKMA